jgi:hypothetical protein
MSLLIGALPKPQLGLVAFNDRLCAMRLNCAPSFSRPAVSPTNMRSKTGRPCRFEAGCAPASRKNEPRRRTSRTRRRSRLLPNASPPSDRPRQPHRAQPAPPCFLIKAGGPANAGSRNSRCDNFWTSPPGGGRLRPGPVYQASGDRSQILLLDRRSPKTPVPPPGFSPLSERYPIGGGETSAGGAQEIFSSLSLGRYW